MDHQSAGIANVAASHSGSLNLTGFTTHGNCLQCVLGKPGLAFQMDWVDIHIAKANGKSMQTDIKAERACAAAFENKVHSTNVEIQIMKCMMQNMAKAVQAMQNMMKNLASANLMALGLP